MRRSAKNRVVAVSLLFLLALFQASAAPDTVRHFNGIWLLDPATPGTTSITPLMRAMGLPKMFAVIMDKMKMTQIITVTKSTFGITAKGAGRTQTQRYLTDGKSHSVKLMRFPDTKYRASWNKSGNALIIRFRMNDSSGKKVRWIQKYLMKKKGTEIRIYHRLFMEGKEPLGAVRVLRRK